MVPRDLLRLPLLRAALFTALMAQLLPAAQVAIRLSVGERSPRSQPVYLRVAPVSPSARIEALRATGSGPGSLLDALSWSGQAGAGVVASLSFRLDYPSDSTDNPRPMHVMWSDLISHSDAGTAARLSRDWSDTVAPAAVRVSLSKEGQPGFTFTVDQLLREKALWIPAYDVFLTLDDHPVAFAEHQRSLAARANGRILAQVDREPEANYADYRARWADMGSPTYMHPHQVAPGHIICLSWDSAIAKFGIDRGAGVWSDYGNPDHFRFWFGFGDLTQGIIDTWKSQQLADGLPIVTTVFEDHGIRYEVEQFAFPLDGPPKDRNGEIPMVLLQKVRLTNLGQSRRVVPVSMAHRRPIPLQSGRNIEMLPIAGGVALRERARNRLLLSVQGAPAAPEWHETTDYDNEDKRVARSVRLDLTLDEPLEAGESREFVVKLPSPLTSSTDVLAKLDYRAAREQTLRFWSEWLARGAQFKVPEKTVNDVVAASLWHALRLPRRHGAEEGRVSIDLPYSNFAYDQTGVPWPGVQSIYVDYMLYQLRGYSSVALEELLEQFRLNQDVNGHVSGFANWMMYSPAMVYASAQYYLLSHDRAGFDRLLPYALKALAWCRGEISRAQARPDYPGLLEGPLNDGTGVGLWAINQAYMYAAFDRFGHALAEFKDPRSADVLTEAQALRNAVEAGFEQAAAASPLVQLRDGTWQPYVPSDAHTPRRLMEIWYPSDVDTGPLHLLRLKALPADGRLADFLLNDHEDNLFLKGWGMANEPVYAPQGLAYLYRDDPKAAIRAFYSQLACAFSHTVFEPVEHRWMHGQYFGPPSTDGSWFELFRNLLVREVDDRTLLIGQAAPREWFEDGKEIQFSRAPTYFGPVSCRFLSHANSGTIQAALDLPPQTAPAALLVRFRHPASKTIQSVSVNGAPWHDFDPQKEWVRIAAPAAGHYDVTVTY